MHRLSSPVLVAFIGVALMVNSGCAHAGAPSAEGRTAADPEFATLQARGQQAMGVDQYTSTHLFDALPDGGRIELQRAVDDPAGVAQIRQHLQEISRAFKAGDFDTPAFVHMQPVPGTAVLAAKRDVITYTYRDLPRGGEVRIVTADREAIQAIHEFMAFQRRDHRAGGVGHGEHTGGMNHGGHSGSMDHRSPNAGAAMMRSMMEKAGPREHGGRSDS